jgi:uncharacterized protein (TIGR02246 family)
MASLWAPKGDYTGPEGSKSVGRDELETAFAHFFAAGHGPQLEVRLLSMRMIGKDVAVVEAIPVVTPQSHSLPGSFRATIILARHGGKWQIESLKDFLVYRPSNHRHLRELEWMVGHWVDLAGAEMGVSVESTCQWSDNQNFLIREFTVRLRGESKRRGTQVVGWDPRERQIRSWVFDSHGGFLEGWWERDGDRWLIENEGVLHDGREVSSVNIMRRLTDDRFTLESTERHVDGRPQTNIGPVEVRRVRKQPSEPAEPPKPEALPESILP